MGASGWMTPWRSWPAYRQLTGPGLTPLSRQKGMRARPLAPPNPATGLALRKAVP